MFGCPQIHALIKLVYVGKSPLWVGEPDSLVSFDAAGYCSWRRPIASGLALTPQAVSRNQQFRTLAASSVEKNGGLLLQVTYSG
jgi:hypothetical protein